MAVLENTFELTGGGQSTVRTRDEYGNLVQTNTINAMPQLYRRYREGTGSRVRPNPPDATAYVRQHDTVINPRGSGKTTFRWSGWSQDWAGTNTNVGSYAACYLGPPDHAIDGNISDVALVKAMAKLNKKDLDLGTAWAERGKTARLLGDIALATVDTINDARKGRGRDIVERFKNSGDHVVGGAGYVDTYLTYHYGIKPSLQDVAGAAQALSRAGSDDWRVRAVGTYQESRKHSGWTGGSQSFRFETTDEQRARAVITARRRPLSPEEDIRWALGLDDPLSTAWELTPFSFVADWILPIGDWLAAQNSLKYYTDWVTVISDSRREKVKPVSGFIMNASHRYDNNISGGGAEHFRFRRRVKVGGPLLPVLPIKDPASIDHMAKALSLLGATMARGEIPRFIRY